MPALWSIIGEGFSLCTGSNIKPLFCFVTCLWETVSTGSCSHMMDLEKGYKWSHQSVDHAQWLTDLGLGFAPPVLHPAFTNTAAASHSCSYQPKMDPFTTAEQTKNHIAPFFCLVDALSPSSPCFCLQMTPKWWFQFFHCSHRLLTSYPNFRVVWCMGFLHLYEAVFPFHHTSVWIGFPQQVM